MNFVQLQYFFAVSKTQHIGRAAKILNISPSAISHSIAMLEEELGRPLVEKVGKNICLTSHGKRLAERAQTILADIENAKHEIASDSIEWQGLFRLGATHGLIDRWVMPSWSPIQKAHPKILAEFFSFRSSQVVENVSNGMLDLGLCFAPLVSPGVTIQKLFDVPLRLVVRPEHPALKFKPAKLKEWLLTSFCALPKAFQGIDVCEQHPELKRHEITPHLSFLYDAYDVGAAFVKESDAWSLIPEPFCEWHQLAALPLPSWKASTAICAVSPKSRPLPRPLVELLASLQADNKVGNRVP